MTVNIAILSFGRPRLFAQALRTLKKHTDESLYTLTTYNDGAKLGTGAARNEVIRLASEQGRGEYLYLSDLDVAFRPKWLETLVECYEFARESYGVIALGAYNHPYNPPYCHYPFYSTVMGKTIEVGPVQALATQSWLWRWEDWDKYGPFKATPPGKVRQSEDWEMSQKIRGEGNLVATMVPPLIVNASLTDSFGEDVPGKDLLEKAKVEGVLYE